MVDIDSNNRFLFLYNAYIFSRFCNSFASILEFTPFNFLGLETIPQTEEIGGLQILQGDNPNSDALDKEISEETFLPFCKKLNDIYSLKVFYIPFELLIEVQKQYQKQKFVHYDKNIF